ncbi:DUF3761 domain-containing protein [Streptomyces lydicus]|uniref:DUF3761 domain-containing protein n=1 Tax=Streptomyces lydicus TaxID=47763 RepID=UPI003788D81B
MGAGSEAGSGLCQRTGPRPRRRGTAGAHVVYVHPVRGEVAQAPVAPGRAPFLHSPAEPRSSVTAVRPSHSHRHRHGSGRRSPLRPPHHWHLRTHIEHPKGVMAKCKDGTWSHSKHFSRTCSHHRGVRYWFK